jgi:hypothetical protein
LARIAYLDIETTPNLVWTWGCFKQYINPGQIIKPAGVLCWGAVVEDTSTHTKTRLFGSRWGDGEDGMFKRLHTMLDNVDIVITYNGKQFDLPRINQEFARLRFGPAAFGAHIDLYRDAVRPQFDLPVSKLEFAAPYFGVGKKCVSPGMHVWVRAMQGDAAAQALMTKYNLQDVNLLVKLYPILRPWVRNHPNLGLILGKSRVCPKCGSKRLYSKGIKPLVANRYRQLRCEDCKGVCREPKKLPENLEVMRGA